MLTCVYPNLLGQISSHFEPQELEYEFQDRCHFGWFWKKRFKEIIYSICLIHNIFFSFFFHYALFYEDLFLLLITFFVLRYAWFMLPSLLLPDPYLEIEPLARTLVLIFSCDNARLITSLSSQYTVARVTFGNMRFWQLLFTCWISHIFTVELIRVPLLTSFYFFCFLGRLSRRSAWSLSEENVDADISSAQCRFEWWKTSC